MNQYWAHVSIAYVHRAHVQHLWAPTYGNTLGFVTWVPPDSAPTSFNGSHKRWPLHIRLRKPWSNMGPTYHLHRYIEPKRATYGPQNMGALWASSHGPHQILYTILNGSHKFSLTRKWGKPCINMGPMCHLHTYIEPMWITYGPQNMEHSGLSHMGPSGFCTHQF